MSSSVETLGMRIQDAQRFLQIGKSEIEEGMREGDDYRVRQGCEKVFHALSSAYVALVFAYFNFYRYPRSHDALTSDLDDAGMNRERRFFEQMKEILHAAIYYQGDIAFVDVARRYIDSIEKEISLSLEQISKVT